MDVVASRVGCSWSDAYRTTSSGDGPALCFRDCGRPRGPDAGALTWRHFLAMNYAKRPRVPKAMLEPRPMQDAPGSREKPVRVLYIVDQLTEMGGAERSLVRMIRSLPKERFRSSLVTFQIDRSLPLFASLPCDVHVLPLRRSYDARALRLSLELRRFIRSEDVSIVHTFFETADLWGGLVSRLSRVPILLSSRRDMGILRHPKHTLAYRFVNPLFTRVLTVSEEVRRCCIEVDHLRPERVETLYNGVEFPSLPLESRDACRELMGLSAFKEIVLTIGNIRRVKGIDIFLRAAVDVCKRR